MTTISDIDVHVHELEEQGYTLLYGIRTDHGAAYTLGRFGGLVPQYDGALRYQVKATPGFEGHRYSKSANTIAVHTEAPGWDPPPRYLALHCRVQAGCGSGHTELADAGAFVATLDDAARAALYSEPIDWVGRNMSGGGGMGVRRPVVERMAGGREVVRFSYNLLTSGLYDPPLDAEVAPENLPLGGLGLELAQRAEAFFREQKVSVLIPEDSILVWDNQRMLHARSAYADTRRHLTRYWIAENRRHLPELHRTSDGRHVCTARICPRNVA